ncbi:dihydrodipicolinate synthase family protein [Serpentinicella alkaliphila]|uniref:4-hydroxy-tetrahydrodipicolinate synthase n=1 Tax=Serpentinicella alkaliphila TaxID=1734049 RepID=A0A4R2TVY7_9FIRM|nr:dihydrodipicolinate synthase family protein [Serpentinicella alkaliphila]QUH26862.1 dihydrodipicolinate synthase family protein [Serpentinicella alkaliphila]TCQ08091.1 4-hydroxy-tetrahydrodipicolinate synthase [Serpentinicella alkaliphila]
MVELKGICPIVATPFTDKGNVDYDSMRNLVRVLIEGGCGALTLFGIAGEYYKVTEGEGNQQIKILVDECKKANVPSIISVTSHATEVAVERAKFLEEQGADTLMLLPPFYLKPGAKPIYEHIKAVGEAVNIPIMVQYAPEETGVTITPDVFIELSNTVPNIEYFKIENKPNGKYVSTMLKETNGKAKIFIGNAGYQFIEAFDRGAIGAMPGCSMYDVYIKVYNLYLEGKRIEAIKIHTKLIEILNHIRQNVEMIISFEKKILKKRGIIESDYCRKPTFDSDDYYQKLFEYYFNEIKEYFEY